MHRIGFIVNPGISTMSLAVASVFEMANWTLGYSEYELTLISEHGGPVPTSLGYGLQTDSCKRRSFRTVLVAGEYDVPEATSGIVKYLRSAHQGGARVASICTGAWVLAQAGLLDGRRASIHWNHAKRFRQRYPNVALDVDRIFTVDGSIWSSAGMSAGLDLALALVEQDLGREIARETARLLVYHRRESGQSQHSKLLDLDSVSDRVQSALAHAKENLTKPLSVEDLAAVAFLSPRQFSRLFRTETGQTPARAIELLRVESARLMMEAGRFSADEIAQKSGFENRDRMRHAFIRAFGKSPQAIQRIIGAVRV
jgi:transcriptional regulator GlxA family with amidase domain